MTYDILTVDAFIDTHGFNPYDADEIFHNDPRVNDLCKNNRLVSVMDEGYCECIMDEDDPEYTDGQHDEETCEYVNGEGGDVLLGWHYVNIITRVILPDRIVLETP